MRESLILISSLLVCMVSCLVTSEAAPQASLVRNLPGFTGTFPSKHYSGYVTIDGKPTRSLFYYFVVSERNPSRDPLVLWLNGGPGCSSFDGFVYEHGPFNFEAAKQKGSLPVLHLNPHSWSKVSNIIYLDSPAGVGFSYVANGSTIYETGDIQTATDTHAFLLKWLQQFPEFQPNPFYIAGESYAGVYVPTLASTVVKGNRDGVRAKINFKGYMVGNGVCDKDFDGNALVPFAHGMGLVPDSLFEETVAACKGKYTGVEPSNIDCYKALTNIDEILQGLNIYNILEPCYHKPAGMDINVSLPLSFKQLGLTDKPLAVRKRMYGRAWPLRAPVRDGIVPLWPQLMEQMITVPCVNDEVATVWLNNDAVKKAIHIRPESAPWTLCTGRLSYKHDVGSMISHHKNLTASGYRALIYSGDHDMCVPFTGTQAWTRSLGYNVVDQWRSWNSNQEIAGFVQEYADNLTFLTIKGAGHTVPEYKPREALDFYSRWLQGLQI